jgi:hypothetical protein
LTRAPGLAGLVSLVMLVAGCTSPGSPQARLESFLGQAVAAAEARDTGEFMDLIATDYHDAEGHDRDMLRDYLRGLFLRYGSIHADVQVLEAGRLNETGGEVELSLGLAGQRGDNNPLWSLGAQRYRLRLELVAEGPSGAFRLLRASWGPEQDRE